MLFKINNDGIIFNAYFKSNQLIDPNIVKKKSFFSKKEIDNENYSQSSEDSCNSYYTCKSSEEVINRSNMEDLVWMDPCEPQSWKQIYHLHGKLFVQDRVWDDIDVDSFEEHKSTPWISIPESVVNYR